MHLRFAVRVLPADKTRLVECLVSLCHLQATNCGIVESILNWVKFKAQTQLNKKCSSVKHSKIKGIPKLDDANDAGAFPPRARLMFATVTRPSSASTFLHQLLLLDECGILISCVQHRCSIFTSQFSTSAILDMFGKAFNGRTVNRFFFPNDHFA